MQSSSTRHSSSGSLLSSAHPRPPPAQKKWPPENEIIPDSEEERLNEARKGGRVLTDEDSDVQIIAVSHTRKPQHSVIVISSSEDEDDPPRQARGLPSGSRDPFQAGAVRRDTHNKGEKRAPKSRIESEDSDSSVVCISDTDDDAAPAPPSLSPVKQRILGRTLTPYAPILDPEVMLEGDPAILTFDHVRAKPVSLTPGPKAKPKPKPKQPKAPASAPVTPRKPKAVPKRQLELEEYTRTLFSELNETVFHHGMPPETEIVWNKRLSTTAGRATWKRDRNDVVTSMIELAPKVVDSKERVRNTLAHEMCHLAVWVIDGQPNAPSHGSLFKAWSARVTKARSDIIVSTKHGYEIDYLFRWKCLDCSLVYGRHSKSINPQIQRCELCFRPHNPDLQDKGYLQPQFDTGTKRIPKTTSKSRLASNSPRGSPRPVTRPPRSPTKLATPDTAEEEEVDELVNGLEHIGL